MDIMYLCSEQARADVRALLTKLQQQSSGCYENWAGIVGQIWTELIFRVTEIDYVVIYYRLNDNRYEVTDLGDGVRTLRLRTGQINQPDVEVIGPGTSGVGLHNDEVLYCDEAVVVGKMPYSVIQDLPDAICKVTLASLQVSRLGL